MELVTPGLAKTLRANWPYQSRKRPRPSNCSVPPAPPPG